jgi:hypothetical protein
MIFYNHEVKNHKLTYLVKVCSHASFLDPVLSVASLASTSQIRACSMLLLPTAGNSKAQYCDGLYLHKIHTRFHGNRLPGSKVKMRITQADSSIEQTNTACPQIMVIFKQIFFS